jgi:methylase of polypeptide subunit release factors
MTARTVAGMTALTVDELLQRTAERLSAPELLSEDPHQEARELVAHALGILPSQLRAHAHEAINAEQHGALMRLLARRLDAEPTGYLVGAVELLGLRFKVDRRGFIPRPLMRPTPLAATMR